MISTLISSLKFRSDNAGVAEQRETQEVFKSLNDDKQQAPEENTAVNQERLARAAEEHMMRTVAEIASLPQSDAVNATLTAAKGTPWHPFSSALRQATPQPGWTGENAPFVRHPESDIHYWWKEDEKHRREDLDDWLRQRRNPEGHFWKANPRIAIRDHDYPILGGLCDTYIHERNYDWHEWNVVPADETEQKAYKEAVLAYDHAVNEARRFYWRLANIMACAAQRPYDMHAQEQLAVAKNMRRQVIQRLAFAEHDLEQKTLAAGDLPDDKKLDMIWKLEGESDAIGAVFGEPVHSRWGWYEPETPAPSPTEGVSTAIEAAGSPPPRVDTPMQSLPMPIRGNDGNIISWPSTRAPSPERYDSATDDTIPFPDFNDDLAQQLGGMNVARYHMPYMEPRGRPRRGNTRLGELLDQTGVLR